MNSDPAAARARAAASLIFALTVAAYAADVWTKTWAEAVLVVEQPVPVFGTLLRLTLGYNTGVAFGLFPGRGEMLLALSGGIILGVAVWIVVALRTGELSARLSPLGLITGGAVANFIDRLADGRVTDFLDVGIGAARWPTFNVADSAIVDGIGLLACSRLVGRRVRRRTRHNRTRARTDLHGR